MTDNAVGHWSALVHLTSLFLRDCHNLTDDGLQVKHSLTPNKTEMCSHWGILPLFRSTCSSAKIPTCLPPCIQYLITLAPLHPTDAPQPKKSQGARPWSLLETLRRHNHRSQLLTLFGKNRPHRLRASLQCWPSCSFQSFHPADPPPPSLLAARRCQYGTDCKGFTPVGMPGPL